VTVAYALNALELVPFVGVELQLSAWYQVCCTLSFGLLGPMLQSHPPRDKEGDLMGLVPVARNTLVIDHIRSGIRLDLSRLLQVARRATPTEIAVFPTNCCRVSHGGVQNRWLI